MDTHLTADDLAALRRGTLPPEETLARARHLAACRECAAMAGGLDAGPAAAAFREDPEEHPEVETALFRYVDGTLDPQERALVEEHLAACAICRTDVEDLRGTAEALRRARSRRMRRRWAWAAVAALALVTTIVMSRTPAPVPPPQRVERIAPPAPPAKRTFGNPSWDALVASAVTSGRVPMPPILHELRPGIESFRGAGSMSSAQLHPAGVVVETDRPQFRWPPRPGQESRVAIFDGETKVAQSEVLRGDRWRPATPLPRGVVLTWQVRSQIGDAMQILPAPPDPPALFRIAEEPVLREIAAARRMHPREHLLIALLYARAGMEAEALRELRLHVAAHPEARPLLESIERWKPGAVDAH